MRHPVRHFPTPPRAAVSNDFVRGFVTTGLLSALQKQGRKGGTAPAGRDVLRHALQGGAALAAGTAVAAALHHRNYGGALVAAAGGAAGLAAIEYLLRDEAGSNDKEQANGQEEA